ncbi:MAG: MBL fold metallo-hydrolase [Deltaproteobacteria bacterium]|nr:MBL fold metallo-hydrolase [Deltaproteobacteria bacterium]MBW2054003.1 MBL fold metallo-hydrolase [Deltaproteobacteria bacterium]
MVTVAKDDSISIEKLELGPFGTNAYILTCQKTGESVLVDAPGEAEKIFERLEGTTPQYILMTHSHMDHVGALKEVKSKLKVPLAAHASDSGGLPSSTDVQLNDGDVVSFGNIKLRVMHTPGHTPGSLCFLTGKYLISGDTIFPGGPGKTGSPGAFEQIVNSITSKIFKLPGDTAIYPGHGDPATVEQGKQEFEVFSSKPHDPGLCGDVLWLSS